MAYLGSFTDEDPEDDGQGPGPAPPPTGPAFSPVNFQGMFDYVKSQGGGNGGGGGGGVSGPPLGGRPTFNFGAAPQFSAPQFRRPTFDEARGEPGFDFRLKGGSDALERSAAARGVLRTGGTLKDLLEYGQNFASQEYGNVFNRALQEYDRTYRGAHDSFAPKLAEWQLRGNAEMAGALAGFDREWKRYVFDNAPRGGGGGGDDTYDPEPEY